MLALVTCHIFSPSRLVDTAHIVYVQLFMDLTAVNCIMTITSHSNND